MSVKTQRKTKAAPKTTSKSNGKHPPAAYEHLHIGIVEASLRALEAGAVGYLLKDSAGKELVTAIRDLKRGKSYFSQK